MLRVVVDTNVLIRILILPESSLLWMISELSNGQIKLVISTFLIKELITVLNYPRITKKYIIQQQQVERLLNLIYKVGMIVYPHEKITICRDNKDNVILETAVAAAADYIITTDEDLLVISEFRGIKIIKPTGLHTILTSI